MGFREKGLGRRGFIGNRALGVGFGALGWRTAFGDSITHQRAGQPGNFSPRLQVMKAAEETHLGFRVWVLGFRVWRTSPTSEYENIREEAATL